MVKVEDIFKCLGHTVGNTFNFEGRASKKEGIVFFGLLYLLSFNLVICEKNLMAFITNIAKSVPSEFSPLVWLVFIFFGITTASFLVRRLKDSGFSYAILWVAPLVLLSGFSAFALVNAVGYFIALTNMKVILFLEHTFFFMCMLLAFCSDMCRK